MAENWLPLAQFTSSGRPVLQSGEVESSLLSSVDIECEDNPNLPIYKSGTLILTTHRIIWINETSRSFAAIPLGAIIHIYSAKKSITKMFSSPRVRFQVSTSFDGIVEERGSRSIVVTLVLRGSKMDPDSFASRFWEAWRGRAWEVSSSESSDSREKSEGMGGVVVGSSVRMGAGVSGILRREQEIWESTDKSLHDAFQDLNALMSKAKEMVMLAEKMRIKLLSAPTNQASATNDEELGSKQDMQDWLLSVGIASPVTKESAGALYHQQLSRQFSSYSIFFVDSPVILRKFDSGVMVIQNKSHSDEEVFARIKFLGLKTNALRIGISPSDAAMTLGIAPAMAKEHLLTAESKGLLCRDISPEGFRFYINLFREIESNDFYLVKDHGIYNSWIAAVSASG
ncbi:hypothetical protein GIB67_014984 [Kingdonia uniflora]|uniref:Vacuolar protein-sorting-associated protein 36 n=1 Tax=Kingdonia uniflora TaxID=39325 RepID=A0A7J7MTS9_9MAGN|nr:hypothetical protein GIB67_014984 [Kingdonia uniflora]